MWVHAWYVFVGIHAMVLVWETETILWSWFSSPLWNSKIVLVCMYVGVCMSVCMCVSTQGKGVIGYFSLSLSNFSFETGSLTKPEVHWLVRLGDQWGPRIPCLCVLTLGLQVHLHTPGLFFMDIRDPDSRLSRLFSTLLYCLWKKSVNPNDSICSENWSCSDQL